MTITEYTDWFKRRHKRTSSFISGVTLMVFDALAVMLCLGIGFFLVNVIDRESINFKSFISYWIYLPAFLVVFYACKLYPGIMLPPADEVRRFFIASFLCFSGIALSVTVERDDKTPIMIAFLLAIPFALLIMPLTREIIRKTFSKRKWWGIPAVIFCNGENGIQIVDRLIKNPQFGYRPVLIMDDQRQLGNSYHGIPVMYNLADSSIIVDLLKIKMAIIVEPKTQKVLTEDVYTDIFSCFRYNIVIPSVQNISISLSVRDFGGILGYATTHHLTRPINLFFKRCIDLFLLLISMPFVLPVTLIIALLIKLTSPGPIFFGHKRIGKGGKTFTAWKFRSMVVNADSYLKGLLEKDETLRKEWEANQKLVRDPRITPIGKFLRRTSLDELPQLFNILIGNMSFVGPRPIVESEIAKYGKKFQYVFSVLPGLSGMWQISGRSDTGYEERIQLDTYYLQNWSLWLDIWIIIKTVWVVFKSKGAY